MLILPVRRRPVHVPTQESLPYSSRRGTCIRRRPTRRPDHPGTCTDDGRYAGHNQRGEYRDCKMTVGKKTRGIARARSRRHIPRLLRHSARREVALLMKPSGRGLGVIYTTTPVAAARVLACLAWPVALRGTCVLAPVSRFAAFHGTDRARGASHYVAEPRTARRPGRDPEWRLRHN